MLSIFVSYDNIIHHISSFWDLSGNKDNLEFINKTYEKLLHNLVL